MPTHKTMLELILYGIPNCNQVKHARNWLDQHQINYHFHDYKKLGAPKERLHAWVQQAGLEKILNRKGTTWRTLSTTEQTQCATTSGALPLLQEKTSLIKRPILENAQHELLCVGFNATEYEQKLK